MSLQVQIRRNEIIESRHHVNALILNHEGKTLKAYYDDPMEMWLDVFPRSAIKFAQAICFVRSGAVEKFQLDERHIAIACASHHAEKFHTDLVADWLVKMGESETSLECGAHYPADEESSQQLIRAGIKPTSVHNNCSGKHAGMIAAAKAMGFSVRGYANYDHPIQAEVRKILSQLSGFDFSKAKWGIDGCSIPTYALPLQTIGKMMAGILPQSQSHEYVQEAARIVQAIRQYPDMISGSQGFCSQFVKATNGKILAKTGAEGVYVALHTQSGQVLVLKARDGQTRASRAALLWIANENGWLSADEFQALKKTGIPTLQNWAGLTVGDTKVVES